MAGAKAPGTLVELRVLRSGKEQRIGVTLSQRPPPPAKRTPVPAASGFALSPGVLQGCVFETCILLVAVLLMSLASREFASPDWDLEWLVTMPVSLSTLLGVRILERILVNPTGLLMLWPFLSVVAWESGHRIAAPLLGLAVALLLLLITTPTWTVRRDLAAPVGEPAEAAQYPGHRLDRRSRLPLSGDVGGHIERQLRFALGAGASVLDLLAAAWAGHWRVDQRRTRRDGPVAAGIDDGSARLGRGELRRSQSPAAAWGRGRRRPRERWAGHYQAACRGGDETRGRRVLLSPIQARELRLLGRDRNFLVQTLVLPVVILGAQILFNAPGNAFASGLGSPELVAAAAFGIGAYALMFSAFQALNAEGPALWILYSVPHPLETVLREKAVFWGTLCLGYALAVLGLGLAFNPVFSLQQLELMVVVLLGLPIFAMIGASLGVFACDPLAQMVQRRLRPSYVYLYMLLASLYVYAIYASSIWQRTGLIVLTGLLGMALWQKARDHLPYLLDPDASPPARVSVADGLIAALIFFVLQALVALVLSYGEGKLTGRVVLIAFSVAGATTYVCMRFAYWRLGTGGVPLTIGPRLGRAAAWGVLGGSMAAAAAFIYLEIAARTSLFQDVREGIFTGRDGLLWLTVLAVCAAPVFEEFIFRGLIFGGLRRSLGLGASVLASAAIFALVHPAASVIPVFGLGVAAALVYERTGFLLGPMVVHAVYNAAVIAYQALS